MSNELIPFEEDDFDGERPDLGPRAPAWAHHLHACVHSVKVQQFRDRQATVRHQQSRDAEFEELKRKMDKILEAIGSPANSEGQNASGLYGVCVQLDRRLRPFENLRHNAIGAASAAVVLGGVIWFLAGDTLRKVFNG